MFKKIIKLFSYIITLLVYPDKCADAVNAVKSPEELDLYI